MTKFRKILLAVCPHGASAVLDGFAAALPSCIAEAELTDDKRLAAFIGQCAEESAGFATLVEYASGKAYEGRRDLGNIEPGDGARYKGRGLIQLTGRENYREAGLALGLSLEAHPEQAAVFPAAAQVAGWFWKTRALNGLADGWNIAAITRKINGGENGLAARVLYSAKAARALALAETAAGAIADPSAALNRAAAAQKVAAKAKGAAASIATAPVAGVVATPHAANGVSFWVIAALGVVALAVVVWAFLAIRKHENAARTLSAAAKEA